MRVGAGVVLVDSRRFHSRASDLPCGDPWSYSRALVASPYDPPHPFFFQPCHILRPLGGNSFLLNAESTSWIDNGEASAFLRILLGSFVGMCATGVQWNYFF